MAALKGQTALTSGNETFNLAAVCQSCPIAYCKSCFYGGKVNQAGTLPPKCVSQPVGVTL